MSSWVASLLLLAFPFFQIDADVIIPGLNEPKTSEKVLIQDTLTWQILNNLEYKEAKHEQYGTVYLPEFAAEIIKYANKKVIIRGYIIPVDKTTYALSKNVYAACFFCGKSGPETVMGISFKDNPGRLKMDSNALLTGYFRLNGTNVDDWMYSLDEAEILHIK
jgi:hypothetical protein